MADNLNLPILPDSPMFIGDERVMTIEWQEFFRVLFTRVGGTSGPSSSDSLSSIVSEFYSTPFNYTKRINEIEKQLQILIEPFNYTKRINEIEKQLQILTEPFSYTKKIDELEKFLYMFPSLAMPKSIWKSNDLDPSRTKLPGANPPAEDTIEGFEFHRYNRGTEESVYFHWGVPDDFAEGENSVRGYFKFIVDHPPAVADEVVVMGFEYKKISDGDVFTFVAGTATGILNTTIVGGETALIKHVTPTGICSTSGWKRGDTILFRFFRDATNVADTYDSEAAADDNDVWVYDYHLEYLSDTHSEGV